MVQTNADVLLRIRGEADGAERVVKTITGLLQGFSKSLTDSAGDGKTLKESIVSVGSALSQLNKNVGTGGVGKKLAQEMTDAKVKTQSYQQVVGTSAGKLNELRKQLAGVESSLRKNRAEFAETEAGFTRYTNRLDKVKAKQAELEKEDRKLANRRQTLTTANEKWNLTLAKSLGISDKARARNEQRIIDNNAEIHGIDILRRRIEGKRATQARHNAAESAELDPIIAKRQRLQALETGFVSNQKSLNSSIDKGKIGLDKDFTDSGAEIAKFRKLEEAVAGADQEFLKLDRDLRGKLRPAFIESIKTIRAMDAAYADLKRENQAVGQAMNFIGPPTRKHMAAFELTKNTVREAKQALIDYRVQLQAAKQANATPVNSVQGLADRFNKTAGHLQNAKDIEAGGGSAHSQVLFENYQKAVQEEINWAKAAEQRAQDIVDADARTAQSAKDAAAKRKQAVADEAKRVEDRLRARSRELQRTSRQTQRLTQSQTALTRAFNKFYGNNRIQLSILQRMRTEAHGLILTYAGFFAVFRGLSSVIESTKVNQKAQNRLATVVGNDAQLIGKELNFVRRNAERLGIEFGTLSNEYTKFSIATKNTNLEGEKTRDIFLAVAEAARVNGADNEGMAGTFLALTQIVSKGTVTMEELKRQLGDRLPGAVHIMADALGVGTAELFKMIEAGEVTSDSLVQFGQELNKRFGPGLARALKSTQAEIGRLQNVAFRTALRIGEGGFIEAFNELLATIIKTMQSPEFLTFLDNLSSHLSFMAGVVGGLIDNWQLLAAVLGGGIFVKLAPFIALIGNKIALLTLRILSFNGVGNLFSATMTRMNRTMLLWNRTLARGIPLATRLRRGVRLLRLGFRSLFPLLTIAGTILAAFWSHSLTGASDANDVLSRHKDLIDKIANAWDKSGGNLKEYLKDLKDLSVEDAKNIARDARILAGDTDRAFNTFSQRQTNNSKYPATRTEGIANPRIGGILSNEQINQESFRRELNQYQNQFRELAKGGDVELIRGLKTDLTNIEEKLLAKYGLVNESGRIISDKFLKTYRADSKASQDVLDKWLLSAIATNNVLILQAENERHAAGLTRKSLGEAVQYLDPSGPLAKSRDDLASALGLNPDLAEDIAYKTKVEAVHRKYDGINNDLDTTLKNSFANQSELEHPLKVSPHLEISDLQEKSDRDRAAALAALAREREKNRNKGKDPGKDLQDAAKALIDKKGSTEELFNLSRPDVAIRDYQTDPGLSELRDTFQNLSQTDIPAAIQAVLDYYQAFTKPTEEQQKIIAQWKLIQIEQREAAKGIKLTWEDVTDTLAGSINGGFDTFIEEIIKTEKAIQSLGLAFREFASDFLIQIGQMIQQQIALNIAKGVISTFAPGGFIGQAHTGGIVGSGLTQRSFAIPAAVAYHTGGRVGYAPDEVPIIALRNEEVLTKNDPRHRDNGGLDPAPQAPPVSVTTIVVTDKKRANDKYFNTPEGRGEIVKIVHDVLGG